MFVLLNLSRGRWTLCERDTLIEYKTHTWDANDTHIGHKGQTQIGRKLQTHCTQRTYTLDTRETQLAHRTQTLDKRDTHTFIINNHIGHTSHTHWTQLRHIFRKGTHVLYPMETLIGTKENTLDTMDTRDTQIEHE